MIITRKSQIESILSLCLQNYKGNLASLAHSLHSHLLQNKVRFPMLEYAAQILFEQVSGLDQFKLCDEIHILRTEGGNVILGKLLQLRLASDWHVSMARATKYIRQADVWYVCDIIGERVFGYSLLNFPDMTIEIMENKLLHENHWVIRALGAGIHYAVKKELSKDVVTKTFEILFTHAKASHKEIRQGIGWAAKTTAKFHPEIIVSFRKRIEDPSRCDNWFRKKVQMGLERNQYAQGN